jgi:CheY-like chemotaxis protein
VRDRILVVDDQPQNLKLLRVVLATAGYDVTTAVDAEDALRQVAERPPRLVLTDLQLPGLDGLALTARLKSNPEWSSIVVIAVTAYAMKGDREKALAAGCDAYVSKPIEIDALVELVARHLATSRGNEAT